MGSRAPSAAIESQVLNLLENHTVLPIHIFDLLTLNTGHDILISVTLALAHTLLEMKIRVPTVCL